MNPDHRVYHRVIWSQGMYLQPHHFQQEARFTEHLVDARVRAGQPDAWGFDVLVLDESQLALGRVALLRARGVLPDGTPFSIPDVDAEPAALTLPADTQGEVIVLAVPRARSGVTEVDYGDGVSSGAGVGAGVGAGDGVARYAVADVTLRDQANAADDPEPIQLGLPRLQLLRQRDAGDAYACLGLVRVVERRADAQLLLDAGYIAPQTRLDATGQLNRMAALIHGLVQQRARHIAAQMGQLGQGLSEVAEFLMLQLLNRSEPLLQQLAGGPNVHPRVLQQCLLPLAGELATFSGSARVPPAFALYQHDDLQATFTLLVQTLREQLSVVMQRHAQQVPLVDRLHGVSTAVVTDAELLRTAGFVLAVRAQLPDEQLRQRFPAQSKLGPVDRIKDLVNLQLPGIPLRSLPVAPRQLPYHAGSLYFEMERQGELWKQFERSGNLALHVAGDFPGLELELWALRQP